MTDPPTVPASGRAARRPRWSKAMKGAFLDHLAASGDVAQAARAIGRAPLQAYALYRRDARFRADWQEAVAAGYQLLEIRLIGQALTGGSDAPAPAAQFALQLLQLQRGGAKPPRAKPPPRLPTPEETDAAILKKLAAIERRKAGGSKC